MWMIPEKESENFPFPVPHKKMKYNNETGLPEDC
jgi:hypothetical protein